MFKKVKTVDSIIQSLITMVDDLTGEKNRQEEISKDHTDKMYEHQVLAQEAHNEADRAERIREKLQELIS